MLLAAEGKCYKAATAMTDLVIGRILAIGGLSRAVHLEPFLAATGLGTKRES